MWPSFIRCVAAHSYHIWYTPLYFWLIDHQTTSGEFRKRKKLWKLYIMKKTWQLDLWMVLFLNALVKVKKKKNQYYISIIFQPLWFISFEIEVRKACIFFFLVTHSSRIVFNICYIWSQRLILFFTGCTFITKTFLTFNINTMMSISLLLNMFLLIFRKSDLN